MPTLVRRKIIRIAALMLISCSSSTFADQPNFEIIFAWSGNNPSLNSQPAGEFRVVINRRSGDPMVFMCTGSYRTVGGQINLSGGCGKLTSTGYAKEQYVYGGATPQFASGGHLVSLAMIDPDTGAGQFCFQESSGNPWACFDFPDSIR
ncbi:hypothetical protein [Paraburkholderia sp.]|uniref:hypothetical protein n=1 Tax=Paraburkholderia sp. TaxID=1926495 RepID=UPI003C7B80F1